MSTLVSFAKLEDGVTRTLGSAGDGADDATDGSNCFSITGIENVIGTQGDDILPVMAELITSSKAARAVILLDGGVAGDRIPCPTRVPTTGSG